MGLAFDCRCETGGVRVVVDVALSRWTEERLALLCKLTEALDLTADLLTEAQGGELRLSCTETGDAYRLTAADGVVIDEGNSFLPLVERLSKCLDLADSCQLVQV